jgi:hypothetical protein
LVLVDFVGFDDVCVADDADAEHDLLVVHPSAGGLAKEDL